MSKNTLTLQINSLEALEKLIGGDTEVEIDIRNNIVQAFTEKHLKAVVNSETIQNHLNYVSDTLKKSINIEVQNIFGTWENSVFRDSIKLNDKTKLAVKNEVYVQLKELVQQCCKEQITAATILTLVKKEIKELIVSGFDPEIKNQLSALVKNKIDTLKVVLMEK